MSRTDAKYDDDVASPVKSIEELQERVDRYGSGSSSDDVSITSDGRRLDTKEKILAWLAEVDADEAADKPWG